LFDPGYASFGLGVASASNSLDARLLDHIAPFLDIGGDEVGKLVWRGAFRFGSESQQALTVQGGPASRTRSIRRMQLRLHMDVPNMFSYCIFV
jgi:hypothetical protein